MFRKIYLVSISAIMICLAAGSCTSRALKEEKGFKIYGKFCGPDHPYILESTVEDDVRKLQLIEPDDDLDAACQRHDICYTKRGSGHIDCDRDFLNYATTTKFEDTKCIPFAGLLSLAVSTAQRRRLGDERNDAVSAAEVIGGVVTAPYRAIYGAGSLMYGAMTLMSGQPINGCFEVGSKRQRPTQKKDNWWIKMEWRRV